MTIKRTLLLSLSISIPLLITFSMITLFNVSFVRSAHAAPNAIVTVNNLNDSGAGSLRQAISDATDGDTINFSASGTIILASELVVDKGITISGTVPITISGNNATRVFNVTAGNVTFDNLAIISGTVTGNGGGIFIGSSTGVTVSNSTLSGNSADYGGGIANWGTALTVSNSTLSGNLAAYLGGGINNGGGTATVSNSTLSGNSAAYLGGGIHNGEGTVTVNNSTLSGNSADYGGGIHNYVGTAMVSNSTLSGNSADEDGGGIFNYEDTVTVSNSTLSGNSADGDGGGIFIHDYAMATVSNSTLSGNSADKDGGGIFNNRYGTATVSNSTFSGNSALIDGGGIYNSNTVTMSNSIMAYNACAGNSVTSIGYNLSSDDSCTFNTIGDMLNTNPTLGPLADNGGPTLTHAPLSGSPVIDAGDCSNGPAIDQRGFLRPQDNTCDIGAFETPLILTVNSVGSGSVTQNPVQADYEYGEVVTVTAVPDSGWSFASWSGALSTSTNPEIVTMDSNKTITATFSNDPPTAEAGVAQSVAVNQSVTLDGSGSADADPSQTLSYGWVQTGGTMVVLSDETAVSPTFTAPASKTVLTFTLTVTDNFGIPSAPSEVTVTVSPYSIFLPMVIK